MKKYWKIIPAAALILLFGGSILHRPLWYGVEMMNAATAQYQASCGGALPEWAAGHCTTPLYDFITCTIFRISGSSPFWLRLPSALGILLTSWLFFAFLKRKNAVWALGASLMFPTGITAFWLGTSVVSAPLTVLLCCAAILCGEKVTEEEVSRRRAGYSVIGGCMAGAAVLAGGFPAAALLGCYLLFSVWRRREFWLFPAAACAVALPLLTLWRHRLTMCPDFVFVPDNCAWLAAAVLPWGLLAPAAFAGWRAADAQTRKLGALGAVSWAAGLCCPLYFPEFALAGTALLTLLYSRMLSGALSLPEGTAGFNRQIRTVSILLGTCIAAVAALQLAAGFTAVDKNMLLYRRNESWVIAVLVMFIPLLWWHMACMEKDLRIKITAFAAGCAFMLLSGSSMLPAKFISGRMPETVVAKYVKPLLHSRTELYASGKFLPALYRVTGRSDIKQVPDDLRKLAAVLRKRKGEAAVLLDTFYNGTVLPAAGQRMWIKDAGLFVLYFNRINTGK